MILKSQYIEHGKTTNGWYDNPPYSAFDRIKKWSMMEQC